MADCNTLYMRKILSIERACYFNCQVKGLALLHKAASRDQSPAAYLSYIIAQSIVITTKETKQVIALLFVFIRCFGLF